MIVLQGKRVRLEKGQNQTTNSTDTLCSQRKKRYLTVISAEKVVAHHR